MNPFGYFRAAVVCALVATSTYRWHAANTALADAEKTIARLLREGRGEAESCAMKGGDDNRPSLEEVMLTGQIFFAHKVSELIMPLPVQKVLNFDNSSYEKERFTTGIGLNLLTEAIPADDDQESQLDFNIRIEERMKRFGGVVVTGAVDKKFCKSMAHRVYNEIWDPNYDFSAIHAQETRKDLPLAIDETTTPVFKSALKVLYPSLRNLLGGDAELVEFSSIFTFKGSEDQKMHCDSLVENPKDLLDEKLVYTVFVYLDDIRSDMGALDVWPGTHTHYHFMDQAEKDMIRSAPAVRIAVPAGTLIMYDSRLLHRGSANTNGNNRVRPSFYFSFAAKSGTTAHGPTYSIRSEYWKAKLTLDELYLGTRDPPQLPLREDGPTMEKCMQYTAKYCKDGWKDNEELGEECYDSLTNFLRLRSWSEDEFNQYLQRENRWGKTEPVEDFEFTIPQPRTSEALASCWSGHIQKQFHWGLYGKPDIYTSARASWGYLRLPIGAEEENAPAREFL